MLHARLLIDLPREPLPRSGAITRLLLSLVSDPGPDEDRDRLLGDALETLRTTLHAFGEAGVDDVVVLRVGDEVIYADDEQRLDDADQALARVVASGRLQRGFGSLRVVLSHRGEGLHTVVQIELDEEVVRGHAPLSVELVARISALRVRADEGPARYRERVDAWLAAGGLDLQLETMDRLTQALSVALAGAFGSVAVRVDPPTLRVVAPGPVQVARLRHLGFRARLRPPTYRPVPKGWRRSAAYDHPHVHCFFDPYHDLLSLVVVDALLDGRAPARQVTVVDPDATVLFELDHGHGRPESVTLPVARGLVTLLDDRVVVDDSIPVAGMDVAEAGRPHAPGYGGEGWG